MISLKHHMISHDCTNKRDKSDNCIHPCTDQQQQQQQLTPHMLILWMHTRPDTCLLSLIRSLALISLSFSFISQSCLTRQLFDSRQLLHTWSNHHTNHIATRSPCLQPPNLQPPITLTLTLTHHTPHPAT
jgi:hypothetical protein